MSGRDFVYKDFDHDQHDIGGPNRVFGKTEDLGFLSVKKVKTKFLAK